MSRRFVYYGSFASVQYFTDFFGVPDAAYSLRKLSPNSVYSGAAIRVRRSSDNTEQDINFVSSSANAGIDTTALLLFVGAGNGFVTTWYNQNGSGNHAAQTTAANQPRIVNAGVVELDNTKPAIFFDGSNDFFALNSTLSLQKIMSLFTLSNNNNKSVAVLIGSTSPISNYNSDNLRHTINANGTFAQVSGFEYGQRIRSIHRNNSTTNEVYQNNTLFTITLTNNDFTIKEIGRRADLTTFTWLGQIQEMIFYSTNKISDRTSIESNINAIYNVF